MTILIYSSGEEVLALYLNGTPNTYTGITTDFGIYSWHKQEMQKGRYAIRELDSDFNTSIFNLAGTTWMGWGFEGIYFRGLRLTGYTQSQANSATIYNLQTNPVFRHDPYPNMTYIPSNSQINEMLAKGIPALSGPAGSRPILADGEYFHNKDMNLVLRPNGWPLDHHSKFIGKWLHSDIKNVAFRYLFSIFDQFVSEGDLR